MCGADGVPKRGFPADRGARIVEEIWHDEPTATWEKAKKLLAEGHDRHDVIHLLAEPRYGLNAGRGLGAGRVVPRLP